MLDDLAQGADFNRPLAKNEPWMFSLPRELKVWISSGRQLQGRRVKPKQSSFFFQSLTWRCQSPFTTAYSFGRSCTIDCLPCTILSKPCSFQVFCWVCADSCCFQHVPFISRKMALCYSLAAKPSCNEAHPFWECKQG